MNWKDGSSVVHHVEASWMFSTCGIRIPINPRNGRVVTKDPADCMSCLVYMARIRNNG